MIIVQAAVGDSNLISIEVEQIIKAINLYTLLFVLPTLSSYLLVDSLKLLELELCLVTPTIKEDYSLFRHYITKEWL